MSRQAHAVLLALVTLVFGVVANGAGATTFTCSEVSVLDPEAPLFVDITLSADETAAILRFQKGQTTIAAQATVNARLSTHNQQATVYALEATSEGLGEQPFAAVEFSTSNGRGAVDFISGPWQGWWNFLSCQAL